MGQETSIYRYIKSGPKLPLILGQSNNFSLFELLWNNTDIVIYITFGTKILGALPNCPDKPFHATAYV